MHKTTKQKRKSLTLKWKNSDVNCHIYNLLIAYKQRFKLGFIVSHYTSGRMQRYYNNNKLFYY